MTNEKGSNFKQATTTIKSVEHGCSWASCLHYYKSDTFSENTHKYAILSDTFYDLRSIIANWSDTNSRLNVKLVIRSHTFWSL
jgi:hypothetical protein